MAISAFVHAVLAEAASLGAAADDHLVIAVAFSDSRPNLAHWNGVFASSLRARSSTVAAIAAAIATVTAAAAAAATHRRLDPLDITWNSSPNSGHPGDVASSVSERSYSGNFVFPVGAPAGDRTAGIPHAAADATVAEAVVIVLSDRAPFASAVGIAPDFRSDRLEFFVPIFFFGFHGESPAGNVAELALVIGSFFRQASRSDRRIVEGDRRRHAKQRDVVVVAGSAMVQRMFDDLRYFVIDFVRISLVDVVLADGDGVIGGIGRLLNAMTRRQHPILVQDRTAASTEFSRTRFLHLEFDLPRPFSRSRLVSSYNATRRSSSTALGIRYGLTNEARESYQEPHFAT